MNNTKPKGQLEKILDNYPQLPKLLFSNLLEGYPYEVESTYGSDENNQTTFQLEINSQGYFICSIDLSRKVVCFNGDRLLGGCQAGLVVGRDKYISAMRKNPLYDAIKPAKLTISALEGTLRSYIDTDMILENNLALKFLVRPYDEIASMATGLIEKLGNGLNGFAEMGLSDGYSRIESLAIPPEKLC